MLRRVVDLSLQCDPLNSLPLSDWPLASHVEPTGPGHPRQFVQRVCHITPYRFDNGEIGVDIYLGDSLPHTHAESLFAETTTILDQIPKNRRWAVRDIASVPAAEWAREAAVIDLTHLDPNEAPSLAAVKEAAQHLRWGDFVIWRTGYHKRVAGPQAKIEQLKSPGIPFEVAQWMVEKKGISGIMSEIPVDPVQDYGKVGALVGKVHPYFYQSAVLMVDVGINLDQLEDNRVFFCGGLCLKTSGIGSSPARAIALQGKSPELSGRKIVDLFTPMRASSGLTTSNPIQRLEPLELQPDIFKRYEVFGMQLAADPSSEEDQRRGAETRPYRDFGCPIRLFNSHLGTHIRIPHAISVEAKDGGLAVGEIKTLTSEQLVGPACLVDLTSLGPRQIVSQRLLEKEAANLQPGDIALLWTGFSDRYYKRSDFLQWSPRFDLKGLEWLIDRGAKMLVTDAASLEPHPWEDHLPSVADPLLSSRSIPAIVCATNMWLLRKNRCFVICSPTPLEGLPTSPTRVIAVEDWE